MSIHNAIDTFDLVMLHDIYPNFPFECACHAYHASSQLLIHRITSSSAVDISTENGTLRQTRPPGRE